MELLLFHPQILSISCFSFLSIIFLGDPKKYLKSAFFASYLEIFLLELMRLQVFFKDLKKKTSVESHKNQFELNFQKKERKKSKCQNSKKRRDVRLVCFLESNQNVSCVALRR